MSTSYTLPTQGILTDALEIMGVLAQGQTAPADDYQKVLTGLQNILKELPLHGVVWPKITPSPVAIAWSALTPGVVALPADYYGAPAFTRTVNGGHPPVYVIAKAEYDRLQYDYIDPLANPSLEPQRIYIAPNNVGYLWPIPSVNPLLELTYQAIEMDATISTVPDVAQAWIGGLGLWVANECAVKFSVPMADRQDIERRFLQRRQLMLAYAAETAPICFEVVG